MKWLSRFLRLSLVVCLTCCSESPTAKPENSNDDQEIRIVSLSPAISRTLVDFNLEEFIVGRTPHCASLEKTIPAVGDLLNINYEMLLRLEPTHILVQPPLAGIDPHLIDLAEVEGWKIGKWHLNGIEDIENMILELPGVLFANDPKHLQNATHRAAEITNDLANALSLSAKPIFPGRTLIVNAVNPVMAFGVDTYLHDVLIALGGINATKGKGWIHLSFEDVIRLDPEAIIIVVPGVSSDQDVNSLAGPLRKLDITAVMSGRVAVLSHPDAFMPSSALIDVAKELRAILWTFEEGDQ